MSFISEFPQFGSFDEFRRALKRTSTHEADQYTSKTPRLEPSGSSASSSSATTPRSPVDASWALKGDGKGGTGTPITASSGPSVELQQNGVDTQPDKTKPDKLAASASVAPPSTKSTDSFVKLDGVTARAVLLTAGSAECIGELMPQMRFIADDADDEEISLNSDSQLEPNESGFLDDAVVHKEPKVEKTVKNELLKIVDALWEDKASKPFRTPRKDGKLKGHNGDIVEPICLMDIKARIEGSRYVLLDKFCDDFVQLFANARIFYAESSAQYKAAARLHDLYVRLANPLFEKHSFCCADDPYLPHELIPCAVCVYVIQWGDVYYRLSHTVLDTEVNVCSECYRKKKKNGILIVANRRTIRAQSHEFERLRNNVEETEPTLTCVKCNGDFHCACVGFVDIIPNAQFVCNYCGGTPVDYRTRADGIPETALSQFLEKRINALLKKQVTVVDGHMTEPGRVLIRVVSSSQHSIKRSDAVAKQYGANEFPYTYRAIYAFQETPDGQQICFFGLHSQEYGADCPLPNRGYVNLSYLETVKLFQPTEPRTKLYRQIMLTYMDWVRRLGFVRINLWACPPQKHTYYLFPRRAGSNRVMTQHMLIKWYEDLLEAGRKQRIVLRQMNAYEAFCDTIKTAGDVPYFHENHMQVLVDDATEEEQRVASEVKGRKRAKQVEDVRVEPDAVGARFLYALEQSKRAHLVIDLVPVEKTRAVVGGLPRFKEDPDPTVSCDVVEDREEFFDRCKELALRFSDERQAKYATKFLCYWIHTEQTADAE